MPRITRALRLLVALAAAPLVAQAAGPLGGADPSRAGPPSVTGPLGLGAFRVPIHTQNAGGRLGAYGWWAAGDAYKVSFHDGFEFFPILGKSYPENLPWRWRTCSITGGGAAVADLSAPVHAHTDWRYAYRSEDVVEAYDVRPEGVEQSFVIARRPSQPGDLVVEGRVVTDLVARPVAAAHQELVFADRDGTPLVRYGKAFAIDARGEVTPVTTAYDGERLRLVVAGNWIAHATFPVTIDPLTSAILVASSSTNPENVNVHREDESAVLNTMFVYSRWASGGDQDVYAQLAAADFSQAWMVFSEVSSIWSSILPDVTFVGGADRWVVGYWRHTPTGDSVGAYFHDKESLTLNGGHVASHYIPTEHMSFVSVGGRSHPSSGTNAVMAYRSDPFFGNSDTSRIWAVELDALNRRFGGRTPVSSSAEDGEAPDVNCQIGWNDDAWLIAYQSRDDASDDYDIKVGRIAAHGFGRMGTAFVGPSGMGDQVRPVIQGWDGRYLVAMLDDVTAEINGQHFARSVLAARLDWPGNGSNPVSHPHRTVATSVSRELTHLALGFDGVSRSHWCLLFDRDVFSVPTTEVRRLGYTGAVTESADLATPSYHAAATWNGITQEFVIVHCRNTPGGSVYGRRLQYAAAARNRLYGSACGPGAISSDTTPVAGSQFYRVTLENTSPWQLAAVGLAFGQGSTPLGGVGAPGCVDHLAPGAAYVPISTGPNGRGTIGVALPDAPLFQGDLFWQYVYTWPAAPTPLAIGVTRGLHTSVR